MCIFCSLKGGTFLEKKYTLSRLPPTEYTFFMPKALNDRIDGASQLVDDEAMQFLPQVLKDIWTANIPVLPIRTEGDGNCLPRSLSRAMWGTEGWHTCLRERMAAELAENAEWYRPYFMATGFGNETMQDDDDADADWARALEEAGKDSAYLQPIHIFALCHVIRRPIYFYAPDDMVDRLGHGATGTGTGLYVPCRFPAEECCRTPIAIAWASERHNHYVPLVGLEDSACPMWPPLPPAFPTITIEDAEEYVEQDEHVLSAATNPLVKGLKEAAVKAREAKLRALSRVNEHPVTGEMYDVLFIFARRYIAYNNEDDLDMVAMRFADMYDFTPEQLARLIRAMQARNPRDGKHTDVRGDCDCGYKHWIGDKAKDFVIDYDGFMVGWDLGEPTDALVDDMIREEKVDPNNRETLLSLMAQKEQLAVKDRPVRDAMEAENKESMQVDCPGCQAPLRMLRYQPQGLCPQCSCALTNPHAFNTGTCSRCATVMQWVKGRQFVECQLCKHVHVFVVCPTCKRSVVGNLDTYGKHVSCPGCTTPIIMKSRKNGTEEASRTEDVLIHFPHSTFTVYDTFGHVPRLLDAILKTSTDVDDDDDAEVRLSEAEQAVLRRLCEHKLGKDDQRLEQDEYVLVTQKLLHWPAAVRYPCMDLFGSVLLHADAGSQMKAHDPAHIATAQLICDAGFKERSSDWRLLFVSFKAFVNVFHAVQAAGADAHCLECFVDPVLAAVEDCSRHRKEVLVQAAASVVLNFAVMLRHRKSDKHGHMLAIAVTTLLPLVRSMADDRLTSLSQLAPEAGESVKRTHVRCLKNAIVAMAHTLRTVGTLIMADVSLRSVARMYQLHESLDLIGVHDVLMSPELSDVVSVIFAETLEIVAELKQILGSARGV